MHLVLLDLVLAFAVVDLPLGFAFPLGIYSLRLAGPKILYDTPLFTLFLMSTLGHIREYAPVELDLNALRLPSPKVSLRASRCCSSVRSW